MTTELKLVTKTQYVYAFEYGDGIIIDGSRYGTFSTTAEPKEDDICLGSIEVSYEIPTDDSAYDRKAIEALRNEKKKIIAQSRAEQQKIDDKIQQLSALEYLPELSISRHEES